MMLVSVLMLERADHFQAELRRYLAETLHVDIDVRPYKRARAFPAFIEHLYQFFQAEFGSWRCVLLVALKPGPSVAEIAKHVRLVRRETGGAVAFATEALSARDRSRLIKEGVAFVVPGNQLYIPELAMDLRERFRAARQHVEEALSPAGQAVLFYHLLKRHDRPATPSRIADELGYSAMTIGRAFDDIVAHGLASSERDGKRRYIHFKFEGQKLFHAAERFLRTAVRSIKYVEGPLPGKELKLAGESALSELSDLAQPRLATYAIVASKWKDFIGGQRRAARDKDDADYIVETWSYDPRALSEERTIDPLSLYVQYKDNPDERVASAAEAVLSEVRW